MLKMADFCVPRLDSSCGVQIVRLGILSSRALNSTHFEHPALKLESE
jgi:hypothetical protein